MKNEISCGLGVENNIKLIDEQNNFLESSLGKVINTGIDIGIRAVLPDYFEEQIIDLKDNLIKYGLKDGIKKSIDDAINIGKSLKGIATGKFENIYQMQEVVKSGGVLDNVSSLLDDLFNKINKKGKINYKTFSLLKRGKNTILNNIEKNINNSFNNQINSLNYTKKYINNWKECFNKKDIEGMEREYKEIEIQKNILAPIENIINEIKKIENVHNLIKNNNYDFNITKDELELANKLV